MERKNQDTILLLLEYNKEFYTLLKERYNGYGYIFIINDSAENVDLYLEKYKIRNADYVVSGLPFASLLGNISNRILKN